MDRMFWECSSLTTLDVSHFDTSKVKYVYAMFEGCTSLQGVDFSKFEE